MVVLAGVLPDGLWVVPLERRPPKLTRGQASDVLPELLGSRDVRALVDVTRQMSRSGVDPGHCQEPQEERY